MRTRALIRFGLTGVCIPISPNKSAIKQIQQKIKRPIKQYSKTFRSNVVRKFIANIADVPSARAACSVIYCLPCTHLCKCWRGRNAAVRCNNRSSCWCGSDASAKFIDSSLLPAF